MEAAEASMASWSFCSRSQDVETLCVRAPPPMPAATREAREINACDHREKDGPLALREVEGPHECFQFSPLRGCPFWEAVGLNNG